LGNGVNFKNIVCDLKDGVDPNPIFKDNLLDSGFFYKETSDEFFDKNTMKYNLIFIDGLHTSDQVEKDIVNAWNCVNKGGIILLHDINPPTYESQLVPRHSTPWKGDVWRAFIGFMNKYPKIKAYTTNHDTGIGWIWKSGHKINLGFIESEMTYKEFDKNRNELLRLNK